MVDTFEDVLRIRGHELDWVEAGDEVIALDHQSGRYLSSNASWERPLAAACEGCDARANWSTSCSPGSMSRASVPPKMWMPSSCASRAQAYSRRNDLADEAGDWQGRRRDRRRSRRVVGVSGRAQDPAPAASRRRHLLHARTTARASGLSRPWPQPCPRPLAAELPRARTRPSELASSARARSRRRHRGRAHRLRVPRTRLARRRGAIARGRLPRDHAYRAMTICPSPFELDDLELACGLVFGRRSAPGAEPSEFCLCEPLQALKTRFFHHCSVAPCVVSFSGGRDSSAVLAVAVTVARREGLPLPIPASNVFATGSTADESPGRSMS